MYDLNFYNVHKESDNIIYTTFVLFIFSQLHWSFRTFEKCQPPQTLKIVLCTTFALWQPLTWHCGLVNTTITLCMALRLYLLCNCIAPWLKWNWMLRYLVCVLHTNYNKRIWNFYHLLFTSIEDELNWFCLVCWISKWKKKRLSSQLEQELNSTHLSGIQKYKVVINRWK